MHDQLERLDGELVLGVLGLGCKVSAAWLVLFFLCVASAAPVRMRRNFMQALLSAEAVQDDALFRG